MRAAEQHQAVCKGRGNRDFVALGHGDFPTKKPSVG